MLKKVCLCLILLVIVGFTFLYGYKYGDCFAIQVNVDEKWETAIANSKHYIDADYVSSCIKLANGEQIDERIYPYLQAMFDDARKKGLSICVRSGYRNYAEQKQLWDNEIDRLDEQGITFNDALKQGNLFVSRLGMSEHQTGLAVDINSEDGMDSALLYNWLEENSYKYGFILRYPKDKIYITGIGYEAWHFRYVGKQNAEIMTRENFCLEELVDELKCKIYSIEEA